MHLVLWLAAIAGEATMMTGATLVRRWSLADEARRGRVAVGVYLTLPRALADGQTARQSMGGDIMHPMVDEGCMMLVTC